MNSVPVQSEEFVRQLGRAQSAVFAYIFSLTHDWHETDEIAQETNLVLWRKFSQFEAGTDFLGWACRVAYFEVLRARQQRPNKELLLANDVLETLAVEAALDIHDVEATHLAITRCLDRLSAADRHLVQLRYSGEADTKSVAEHVGRSVTAVYKALNRIRWKLLDCLRFGLAAGGSR